VSGRSARGIRVQPPRGLDAPRVAVVCSLRSRPGAEARCGNIRAPTAVASSEAPASASNRAKIIKP
jgi:hypothetical protein